MTKSETLNELGVALAKVQGSLRPALKDSNNPFYKSKYADLSATWESCRALLSANGLSVIQTNEVAEDAVIVETTLLHSSGQWISGRLSMKPVKNDPQAIGSCITYARRYGLGSIVGIVADDDDGNLASDKSSKSTREKVDDVLKDTAGLKTGASLPTKKERMLELLLGKFKRFDLMEYACNKNILVSGNVIEDWPETSVPKNKAEMEALAKAIEDYMHGNEFVSQSATAPTT